MIFSFLKIHKINFAKNGTSEKSFQRLGPYEYITMSAEKEKNKL